MKKHYFAPVYGPRHELVRYAGVVIEATGPEGACRLKPGEENGKLPCAKKGKLSTKEKKVHELKPLDTGHHAAFEAICATLAEGERVLKRTVRSLG